MAAYDGRISEECAKECLAGMCAAPGSYVSGCGGCCGCLGGCQIGAAEQRDEEEQRAEEERQSRES
jgi:hypothetical protein